MTKINLILYDQLNVAYIDESADAYVYICNTSNPITPQWKLQLSDFHHLYGYASGKSFIESLKSKVPSFKKTFFVVASSFCDGLLQVQQASKFDVVSIMTPAEPYLIDVCNKIPAQIWATIQRLPNKQFLLSQQKFTQNFAKPPVMETFYRWMRKEFAIMVDSNDQPEWWQRTYDKENSLVKDQCWMKQTIFFEQILSLIILHYQEMKHCSDYHIFVSTC